MSGLEPPMPPSALRSEEEVADGLGRLSTSLSLPSFELSSSDGGVTSKPRPARRLVARRTLGIILLLVTVFLWTASSFLASFIFADDSYSKPFFVTYVNTSFFAISLIPILINGGRAGGYRSFWRQIRTLRKGISDQYRRVPTEDDNGLPKPLDNEETLQQSTTSLDAHEAEPSPRRQERSRESKGRRQEQLDFIATAKLSIEFCMLWFAANYAVAVSLKYTTVASSTILTSTSGIWTLLMGALVRVERFSFKKLIGVLASLAGVVLISTVDLSTDHDENRGSFPHKSFTDIAIGDATAVLSALLYGFYTILMKKRIGDEARVNMPLFFGLVGLLNVILLWPGFVIVNYFGDESFELPPTGRIWGIILLNSTTSLISDFCWAYAMLLTSPLVVTVGLSLTIPLSLIGQMILQSQFSSAAYWIGACIVFVSFLFINYESSRAEEVEMEARSDDGGVDGVGGDATDE
ncbi:MAG: hypothetical protein M1838_006149 [Thelocarpon superellum]|nr:MAG: hypothetical protein M1838_006149 [Thelocarpon superellum]